MEKTPSMEELQRQFAENLSAASALLKEAAENHAKAQADHAKAHAKAQADHAKDMAEIREMIKNLGREIGGVGNTLGRALEADVANALWESRDLCGMPLDDIHLNMVSRPGSCEIDLVAVNGSKVAAAEVKQFLREEDVRYFADTRLPRFPAAFPFFAEGREVQGVVIYQRTDAEGKAVQAALDEGFWVLCAGSDKELRRINTKDDITEYRMSPPK